MSYQARIHVLAMIVQCVQEWVDEESYQLRFFRYCKSTPYVLLSSYTRFDNDRAARSRLNLRSCEEAAKKVLSYNSLDAENQFCVPCLARIRVVAMILQRVQEQIAEVAETSAAYYTLYLVKLIRVVVRWKYNRILSNFFKCNCSVAYKRK